MKLDNEILGRIFNDASAYGAEHGEELRALSLNEVYRGIASTVADLPSPREPKALYDALMRLNGFVTTCAYKLLERGGVDDPANVQ